MGPHKWTLQVIVFAQFCCTSLWFASNAIISDLILNYNLDESALGALTSAVQFGFIAGTLVFAFLALADRFSPSKVFFFSALMGALFNASLAWEGNTYASLMILRFLTGFALAGIYPVGMKIAADHFDKGLGKSLGFLVGALVLGTSFPHFLNGFSWSLPWKAMLFSTSALAFLGGGLMLVLIKDGPYRKAGQKLAVRGMFKVFQDKEFRSAAFGYFGHMWELYAFWTFVPLMLGHYVEAHPMSELNIPVLSFLIIGIGGPACVIGSFWAQRAGTKIMAKRVLTASAIFCLAYPLVFALGYKGIFLGFLLLWGMLVVMDSPLFSTLVAQNAPAHIKGTALTLVNSIGFAITIVSIISINMLMDHFSGNWIFLLLAIGPMLGLRALVPARKAVLEQMETTQH